MSKYATSLCSLIDNTMFASRFYLDLDIAAPKITIPTDFYPDSVHPTKLLVDLGKLVIRSQVDFKSLGYS